MLLELLLRDVQTHHKAQTACAARMMLGSRALEVLSSSDTEPLCEDAAGSLSTSPLHPVLLLFLFCSVAFCYFAVKMFGSLEERDCVRTITS